MTPSKAVERAAAIIGSQAALAKTLGVSSPTVNQWATGKRAIPPARAIEIERATGGKIARQFLCPNFPWDAPAPKKQRAS